jgi:hypothetical protein
MKPALRFRGIVIVPALVSEVLALADSVREKDPRLKSGVGVEGGAPLPEDPPPPQFTSRVIPSTIPRTGRNARRREDRKRRGMASPEAERMGSG